MEFSLLGNTDLEVSALCLGTMTFGDGADTPTCRAMYAKAREEGINIFDCANVYAGGESERILGRLVRGHRDEVIIATKAYYPMPDDPGSRGLGRSRLRTALKESLERLNTDFVDLYYLHAFDEATPLEETLATLNEFVQKGSVRYIGVSNFAAWQVMKARSIAAQMNYVDISVVQPMFSLLKRQCESEILPMAQTEGLGVLSYGPLAGGYLTGKYQDVSVSDGRLATSEMYQKRYADDTNRVTTRRFVEFAKQRGVQAASLAIAWAAAHPVVTAPIIGARTVSQLNLALRSLDIVLSDDLRSTISEFSLTPAPATDRSEEQR